jgi:DNA end-binding protein Ku
MAARASWKGSIHIGDIEVPVSLYAAASTSERIAFHMLNRRTGNRLKRQFVDSETGKPVDDEDEVKGYAIGEQEFVTLDPEDVADAVPENDHHLTIEGFIPEDEVDDLFFDRPYFLAPSDKHDADAYAVLRDGLKSARSVALARAVLFRKVRHVLIKPDGDGLVGLTLNFDYQVRSPEEAFEEIPEMEIKGEMLELASHIIGTKKGSFDPAGFDDRYENALAEVVKAKIEGRKIRKPPEPQRGKVIDLMQALRESAGMDGGGGAKKAKSGAKASRGAKTSGGKASTGKASAGKSASKAHHPKKAS